MNAREDGGKGLFAEERQRAIYQHLLAAGKVTVEELAGQFGMSAPTIRNDLARLEEQGLLQRTHGGAIPASPTHKRSITRSIPSSFGCEDSRTSMTYLKASGKASGRVNLPTPVSAAPTTSARWGRTNDKNLISGERELLTPFEFIELNLLDIGAKFSEPIGSVREQWICL